MTLYSVTQIEIDFVSSCDKDNIEYYESEKAELISEKLVSIIHL